MLHGAHLGGLEVRSEGGETRLRGVFPYGRPAPMGAGRSEVIAASAFEVGADLYMLAQHDFDRPLASRSAGTLDVRNGDDALEVTATIPADLRGVSWVADLLVAHAAGLVRGLSPGFRVAPGGERVERRGDGLVRTVTRAELVEISVVTRPAYAHAQVEARDWNPARSANLPICHLRRWRA